MVRLAYVGVPNSSIILELIRSSTVVGNEIALAVFQVSQPKLKTASLLNLLRFLWQSTAFCSSTLKAATLSWRLPRSCRVFITTRVNSDCRVVDSLQRIQPDRVVVYGGKILSKKVLHAIDTLWLNIHGGILPKYRGLDSALWACAARDYDQIGITVHEVEALVDSGRTLLQLKVRPDEQWSVGKLRNSLRSLELMAVRELAQRKTVEFAPATQLSSEKLSYFGTYPERPWPWERVARIGKNHAN